MAGVAQTARAREELAHGWKRFKGLRFNEYGKRRLLRLFDDFERNRKRGWILHAGKLRVLLEGLAPYGDYKRCAYVILHADEVGKELPRTAYLNWMQALDNAGEGHRGTSVLNYMLDRGKEAGTMEYNFLLGAMGRGGQLKKMKDLIQFMESRSVKPDAGSFTALITYFGAKKSMRSVRYYWSEMIRRKIEPTTQVYNAMLRSYNVNDDPKGVDVLYRYMRDTRTRMDTRTYAQAIVAYGRLGKIKAAVEAYREPQLRDLVVGKEVITAFMAAMVRNKHLEAAEMTLNEVLEKKRFKNGPKIDTTMFNVLFDAYAQSANVEKFENLADDMREVGCEPNQVTLAKIEMLMTKLVETGKGNDELFERVKFLRRDLNKMNRDRENNLELYNMPPPRPNKQTHRAERELKIPWSWDSDEEDANTGGTFSSDLYARETRGKTNQEEEEIHESKMAEGTSQR